MRLEVEPTPASTHDGGYPKLSAPSVPIYQSYAFFDLNFASVISLRTLILHWSTALQVWQLICRHFFIQNLLRTQFDCNSHKYGKSIYFLFRDGDPSLRIFLSFCDSSAGRSNARCLWLRVLRGEMGSK